MNTNMIVPGQNQFDWIMASWWVELNQCHKFHIPIYTGGQDPMLDWLGQESCDAIWYYSLDTWSEDDFHNRLWLAQHIPEIDSIHVVTALYLTSMLSEDLLHDIEIPGIWVVRVQKIIDTRSQS